MAGRNQPRAKLARIRKAVYERDGFRCVRCNWQPPEIPAEYDGRYALYGERTNHKGQVSANILELDHVEPFSRGGRFTIENLQVLCTPCNLAKMDR